MPVMEMSSLSEWTRNTGQPAFRPMQLANGIAPQKYGLAIGSGLKAFDHAAFQAVKIGQPDDPSADTDQPVPFHADQLA